MYGHRVALGQAVHAGSDCGNDTSRFVSDRKAGLNYRGERPCARRLIHQLEVSPAKPRAPDLYEHLADAGVGHDHFREFGGMAPLDQAIGFHGSRHVSEPSGLSVPADKCDFEAQYHRPAPNAPATSNSAGFKPLGRRRPARPTLLRKR